MTPPRALVWPAIAFTSVLVVTHLVAVATSLGDARRVEVVHDLAGWIASFIGVVGTLTAARSFGRDDYLRRVWTLFTLGAFFLLLGTALRSHWTHFAPGRPFLESPLALPRMLAVIGANTVSVLALVLLALTYRRSGLNPPHTWRSIALWVLAGGAGLAISVPQFAVDLRRIAEGPPQTWIGGSSFASTLGDFGTVLLIAPILRVAYMLRGGRLAWVWWAMAASGSVWLVYDSREWIAALLPGNAADNLELLRVLRTPGLALVGVAGWLQRSVLGPAGGAAAAAAKDPAQARAPSP